MEDSLSKTIAYSLAIIALAKMDERDWSTGYVQECDDHVDFGKKPEDMATTISDKLLRVLDRMRINIVGFQTRREAEQ